MFRVELSREAQRFFERCDNPAARKLTGGFEALEANPRAGNNVRALKGALAGSYRYRLGDLRVVYTIDDRAQTIFVITIAKRSDVYDGSPPPPAVEGVLRPRVTIELWPEQRKLVQARAQQNAHPDADDQRLIETWAKKERLQIEPVVFGAARRGGRRCLPQYG